MISRQYWEQELHSAFRKRSVVRLMGVRRVGKTVLGRSLEGFEYLDCELPRVRRMLDDPEEFLESLGRKGAVVLDEVHRLQDPAAPPNPVGAGCQARGDDLPAPPGDRMNWRWANGISRDPSCF